MIRPICVCIAVGLLVSLSACGDTCESVKAEAREIEQKIQKDPQSASEYAEEMDELIEKMSELQCFP